MRAGVPPVELGSRFHPVWSDPSGVAALGARYRLPLAVGRDWPAWKCFDAFRQSWCEANGVESVYPGRFDFSAARELGIDVSGSARYRLLAKF